MFTFITIVGWISIGAAVGYISYRSHQEKSLTTMIHSMSLGVLGAAIGGLISSLILGFALRDINIFGIAGAVIGAGVVAMLLRFFLVDNNPSSEARGVEKVS